MRALRTMLAALLLCLLAPISAVAQTVPAGITLSASTYTFSGPGASPQTFTISESGNTDKYDSRVYGQAVTAYATGTGTTGSLIVTPVQTGVAVVSVYDEYGNFAFLTVTVGSSNGPLSLSISSYTFASTAAAPQTITITDPGNSTAFTVNVTGSAVAATVSGSSATGSLVVSPLSAGTAAVTVTDISGNSATFNATVTGSVGPLSLASNTVTFASPTAAAQTIAIADPNNTSVFGVTACAAGTVNTSVSGSSASGTLTITPAAAGQNCVVTVTDSSGNSATVTASVGTGGSVTIFESSAFNGTIPLTSLTSATGSDWAYYGYGASSSAYNYKSGGGTISALSQINGTLAPGASTAGGAVPTISWTDGATAPTSYAGGTLYQIGNTGAAGSGVSFTASGSSSATALKTVFIAAGGYCDNVQLTVASSDASFAQASSLAYTASSTLPTESVMFAVQYSTLSPSTVVTFTLSSYNNTTICSNVTGSFGVHAAYSVPTAAPIPTPTPAAGPITLSSTSHTFTSPSDANQTVTISDPNNTTAFTASVSGTAVTATASGSGATGSVVINPTLAGSATVTVADGNGNTATYTATVSSSGAPTVVDYAGCSTASTPLAACAWYSGSAPTNGRELLACVNSQGSSAIPTPTGWTALDNQGFGAGTGYVNPALFWKVASSEGTTETFTAGASGVAFAVSLLSIAGANTTSAPQWVGAYGDTTSPIGTGSITPATTSSLEAACFYGLNSVTAFGAISGWTAYGATYHGWATEWQANGTATGTSAVSTTGPSVTGGSQYGSYLVVVPPGTATANGSATITTNPSFNQSVTWSTLFGGTGSDWETFGQSSGALSATNIDHRATGGGVLNGYSAYGTGTFIAQQTTVTSGGLNIVWSGGTPDATNQILSQVRTSGAGNGYTIAVPGTANASTTNTVAVIGSAYCANEVATIHTSDASFADVSDTSVKDTGTGLQGAYWNFQYTTASSTANVTITIDAASASNCTGVTGTVGLRAIGYATSTVAIPTTSTSNVAASVDSLSFTSAQTTAGTAQSFTVSGGNASITASGQGGIVTTVVDNTVSPAKVTVTPVTTTTGNKTTTLTVTDGTTSDTVAITVNSDSGPPSYPAAGWLPFTVDSPMVHTIASVYGTSPLTNCSRTGVTTSNGHPVSQSTPIPGSGGHQPCTISNSDAVFTQIRTDSGTNNAMKIDIDVGSLSYFQYIYSLGYGKGYQGGSYSAGNLPFFVSNATTDTATLIHRDNCEYGRNNTSGNFVEGDAGYVLNKKEYVPANAVPQLGPDMHLDIRNPDTGDDINCIICGLMTPANIAANGGYLPVGTDDMKSDFTSTNYCRPSGSMNSKTDPSSPGTVGYYKYATSNGIHIKGTAGELSPLWGVRGEDVLSANGIPHAIPIIGICDVVDPGTTTHTVYYPSGGSDSGNNCPNANYLAYGGLVWVDTAPSTAFYNNGKGNTISGVKCSIIAYAIYTALNKYGGYFNDIAGLANKGYAMTPLLLADINDSYNSTSTTAWQTAVSNTASVDGWSYSLSNHGGYRMNRFIPDGECGISKSNWHYLVPPQ